MNRRKKTVIDGAEIEPVEYEYCLECDRLVEASDIVFVDPVLKISVCKRHKEFLALLGDDKKKFKKY